MVKNMQAENGKSTTRQQANIRIDCSVAENGQDSYCVYRTCQNIITAVEPVWFQSTPFAP